MTAYRHILVPLDGSRRWPDSGAWRRKRGAPAAPVLGGETPKVLSHPKIPVPVCR